MRKFIVEVNSNDVDAVDIEVCINEQLMDVEVVVTDLVDLSESDAVLTDVIDDEVIETKVDEIINSIAGVFNIHQVMYASRISKVKEMMIRKIKEMM